MYKVKDYWKNYMEKWFGSDLISEWSRYCKEETMQSNNEKLHLETYVNREDKPTLIFSHGIAGYGRVLLPFVMPLLKKEST